MTAALAVEAPTLCAWCSQPEGHSGVCGRVLETRSVPKLVGRPRVARFENSAHAIIALYDDGSTRVWWLRHARWERGQEMLEPLWQVAIEQRGHMECVVLTAQLGRVSVRHEGHFVDRRDAGRLLARVPSPLAPTGEVNNARTKRIDEAEAEARALEAEERERVSE